MPEIPIGSLDRIIRNSGVNRVKSEASFALREVLEEIATEIVGKALDLSKNRNQQLISREDVILAYRLYKEKKA